ncbi:retrotransposon protein, putative, ty1-copia subclass [Tanacetum coccineum]
MFFSCPGHVSCLHRTFPKIPVLSIDDIFGTGGREKAFLKGDNLSKRCSSNALVVLTEGLAVLTGGDGTTRTLLDMVRSMMSQTTLPKSFWDYALKSAARILNMVPTKKVDKTPYEIWHGHAPKFSYLKVWGYEELVKRDTLTKPDKLEPRSFKCIFVGYPKETMGYSFYNPSENKVFVARNAEFFESNLIDQEASGSLKDLEIIQEEDTNPSLDTSLNHEEDDQEIDEPQSDINPIRRSSRITRTPDRMCLYIDAEEHELGDLSKHANFKAALLDPEFEKWLAAMNVKMQSIKDNNV